MLISSQANLSAPKLTCCEFKGQVLRRWRFNMRRWPFSLSLPQKRSLIHQLVDHVASCAHKSGQALLYSSYRSYESSRRRFFAVFRVLSQTTSQLLRQTREKANLLVQLA